MNTFWSEEMAKLVIENISIEQARELAHWYEGQGEQDADVWFECQDHEPRLRAPLTDVGRGVVNGKRVGPGWMEESGDTITIHCK